jgi:hypothetical protein
MLFRLSVRCTLNRPRPHPIFTDDDPTVRVAIKLNPAPSYQVIESKGRDVIVCRPYTCMIMNRLQIDLPLG